MLKLKEYLVHCKEAYYSGKPLISDSQYDNLEEICSEDLTVGTNKGRCKHWYRMYSLRKVYTDDNHEVYENVIETPKLDGAAVALRYIDGYLDSIVTRGNGIYGEDVSHLITQGMYKHSGIPAYIKIYGAVQITGELVAPDFISNARNYAAGALNLKSAEEFLGKNVRFFAYDMQPYTFDTYMKTLEVLSGCFFDIVLDDNAIEYPRDGLVYRQNSTYAYKKMGYTSKHPRGAFALKERTEGVETILLRVDWETGKSGKVTPVAILDPIDIDGATVSRATLNNPGFIEALDLRIGDAVMVERAGGIIPRIIRKV
jgi:NAD-dependent DNA ligase